VSLKLYFLRHGQAGNRHEWHGDDSQRPLTVEGKKRMQREAATIWKLALPVDLIITSPLVRAAQTAEIVAKARGSAARLVTDGRLAPGFGPKQLTAIVAEHRNVRGLMLVGHEPDLSETISQLTGGGRLAMKKGALACIEVGDPASLKGTLVWLIPPKVLEL
jgi:phosphohistidine phosphatase